ncbi:hypothetical protein K431DRAFT_291509 [Polychaeton citri CBS 116435]|uniref:Uncharacterized protein n=1 Tax=Polychaeton citri CBS 116435 TaxID=1314669 RepID=A0A9P4QGC1_9PEZI|nr:hypothetical protein K431DRAFT_291509 [Polychaeton citri CBS 116435]
MAAKSEPQPKSSFWSGMLRKRVSAATTPKASVAAATDRLTDAPPESAAPMKTYKPRYAQRDAMRAVSAKEREEVMNADMRARSDACSKSGFSTDVPPFGKLPIHPNFQRSLSGMPFYVAPPLLGSATSSPSSTATTGNLLPIPASDYFRLPRSRSGSLKSVKSTKSTKSTRSASAKLERSQSEEALTSAEKKLSLAQLRSELQAEYEASKRSPHEFDRNLDFRLAHSGFFSTGKNCGPQFSPSKGKQRAMDLKLPGSINSTQKRMTLSRSASSSILMSTPEEEEFEGIPRTPVSDIVRKSSDSTASSNSVMTENTSRQISESGTIDTEVSQGGKAISKDY